VSHRLWPLCTLIAILSGCQANLAGTWFGPCVFSDATYGYTSQVTLDITNGAGSRLEGEVRVDMFDDRVLEGVVEGIRSDSYLELEGTLKQSDAVDRFPFRVEAEYADETMEGTCVLGVPRGIGGLTGALLLEG